MPWAIKKMGTRWCVYKEGDSAPVNGGCHPRRVDAVRQLRALYAQETQTAAAVAHANAWRNSK